MTRKWLTLRHCLDDDFKLRKKHLVSMVYLSDLCGYSISGFGAGNIYYVYYFLYFLSLYILYIDEYEYSCCLTCRGFYKPVLAQHDQCCI